MRLLFASRSFVLRLVLACLLLAPVSAPAQRYLPHAAVLQVQDVDLRRRVSDLEWRLDNVKRDAASSGLVLFLFGAFCALWAQNTGRNPLLWFFLGAFFSVVTVLVLLGKNSRPEPEKPQFDLEDYRVQ